MSSSDFIIWFKGFTEACNDFHPTPKQWDRIKEVLDEVQDYDDMSETESDVEDWRDWYPDTALVYSLSGSGTISISSGSIGTGTTTGTAIWNDQMGCWHFTNYPEGFGYYTNTTADAKKEKQQLND